MFYINLPEGALVYYIFFIVMIAITDVLYWVAYTSQTIFFRKPLRGENVKTNKSNGSLPRFKNEYFESQ